MFLRDFFRFTAERPAIHTAAHETAVVQTFCAEPLPRLLYDDRLFWWC